ncbi:MAG: hypothetical protein ACPLKX_08030 [Dictyoglomaceae bacterium]
MVGLSSSKSIKFIEIDTSKGLGKIMHGAIGGHYALSEPEVTYGMQHPGADVLRVAETFFKAGGRFLQVYLKDPDLDGSGIWYNNDPIQSEDVNNSVFLRVPCFCLSLGTQY